MPRHFRHCLILAAMLLCFTGAAHAQLSDKEFAKLQKTYEELFTSTDKATEFYVASKQMQNHFLAKKQMDDYYNTVVREIFFDIQRDNVSSAMSKTVRLAAEMQDNKSSDYSAVLTTIGMLFETRGNYTMADRFYQLAIDSTPDDSKLARAAACQARAHLNMIVNPREAMKWNERGRELLSDDEGYYINYLVTKCVIRFADSDQQMFYSALNDWQQFVDRHPAIERNGEGLVAALRKAFEGNADEAYVMIDTTSYEANPIVKHDMKIQVARMHHDVERALHFGEQRAMLVDSLMSDLLDSNLTELSTNVGINKLRSEATRDRNKMKNMSIVLLFTTLALLVLWVARSIRLTKRINEKNEQLTIALKMAGETDRMKNEFVHRVSHEIRTPLNAILGFTQLLTDNEVELSEEEKGDMVARMNNSVSEITVILDELLHISDQNSKSLYPRSSEIYVNKFVSAIVDDYNMRPKRGVEMSFETHILNRVSVKSNENGLRKILDHLLQNALKFTSKGSITVSVESDEKSSLLLISVTDTGRGISKDRQKHIFDQFYKEDSFQQGIGLGLTMSQSIARNLDGDLVLDSTYTNGARFVLSLPLKSEE